jgi:hypothetical protein
MGLPIRRAQFQTAKFAAWLAKNGAEVGTPTNGYEVIRYRAYALGSTKAVTHIVYAKENGLLTFSGVTRDHYAAFLAGHDFPGMFVSKLDKPHIPADSKKDRKRLLLVERDGSDCWFCGKPLGEDMTIEHLVPRSKGGVNHLDNYVLAHQACNALAADKHLAAKMDLRASLRAKVPA